MHALTIIFIEVAVLASLGPIGGSMVVVLHSMLKDPKDTDLRRSVFLLTFGTNDETDLI